MRTIDEFIESQWDACTAFAPNDDGTLIGLPRPYITPCARSDAVFQEMYYWDSHFISLGLYCHGRIERIRDIVDNCLYCIERFGFVPNGNRTYFLTRSQPPYLSQMVRMVYSKTEDKRWLRRCFDGLQKELQFWCSSKKLTETGLSRYWDRGHYGDDEVAANQAAEAESGWDYTPRFGNRAMDINPVDLNSNLYVYEADLAVIAELLAMPAAAKEYRIRCEQRRCKINTLCWNADQRIYADFNYKNRFAMDSKTLAAFSPLWAGVAQADHAEAMAQRLDDFESVGGLATCDADYGCIDKQWNHPNGWAPLQWIAVVGLHRYGYERHAERIAEKYCSLVEKIYHQTGRLWEKYNVVEGNVKTTDERYKMPSMVGWTAGVYLAFCRKLYKNAEKWQ